ncbi:GAF and ANTAR domain-containing protein [Arsenicicoccus cauae]|uniref:ANTAR domain-containing protein n=1 Tax=Arsenicicoccus cauae TaxID=2663847 RepID=A0A6I3IDR0_9MICO|nr:GAF and ANTAR domain-containing protein [Arsenicicoccus cauae]MTB72398.1 ANTAR domain-containing protein [Arsenicicoccus cauae]
MNPLPPEASQVFARLNEIVYSGATTQAVYDAIVHATVELVDGCDRAAILLRDRERLTSAAATDAVARGIDELELSIGDGPCLDAIVDEAVQFDPDLTTPTAWPGLAARVLADTPVRGMIGCRLLIDGTKVGALDLFADQPGALTQRSVDQAAIMASLASVAIMTVRARGEAANLTRALDNSRAIGKAVGLIMAARKVDDDEAFQVLRKTSQDLNMKLSLVAEEIVRGQTQQARR